MAGEARFDGWLSWSVAQRLADGVLAMPVAVGFVALGAGVLAGRALRGVLGRALAAVPAGEKRQRQPPSHPAVAR